MTVESFPVRLLRLSTDDLPAHDRIALLREYYGRHIAGVDTIPGAGRDFRASARSLLLPGLVIDAARTTAVSFDRTSALLPSGHDDVILSVMSGPSRLLAEQRFELDVAAGDAVLFPMTHRWLFERGDGEVLSLRLPRSALAALPPPSGPNPVRIVSKDSAPLRLLLAYARASLEAGEAISDATGHLVSRHLQELVTQMLQPNDSRVARRPELGGIAAARLALMKRDIELNLHEPALATAWLAGRHGVKPRYIRSLFESDGTTLSAFVRTRRLHLAHHMLCDPRLLHRKVAEVALDCGFSDLSTFNRAFRREFDVTPTDVRGGAMKSGKLRPIVTS